MQQLVNRLDVAMFNAILRESAKDMPTDPVSDPISDTKVLPVKPGKASFGTGAQLKNIVSAYMMLHENYHLYSARKYSNYLLFRMFCYIFLSHLPLKAACFVSSWFNILTAL